MGITVKELLDKALLALPPVDERLTLQELQAGKRFKNRGGVYIFYNSYHEPLYVGISNRLNKRVPEHIQSAKGNKDMVHYVKAGGALIVEVFYEANKIYQEIYESYLIGVLQPRFNIEKTGRKKVQ